MNDHDAVRLNTVGLPRVAEVPEAWKDLSFKNGDGDPALGNLAAGPHLPTAQSPN